LGYLKDSCVPTATNILLTVQAEVITTTALAALVFHW
jgi:hypothetical protein